MLRLRLMLGVSLLLVVACNARDERPNRDRPANAPTVPPIIAPTSAPATATQTRVLPSPAPIPPTATRAAPTSTTIPTPARLAFKQGRNDYVINVDNAPRQFIVYVPNRYDPSRPTPVVFMFHGSNQSGNVMYESTDWVNKAEKENSVIIFPTGWKYPLIGERGLHEKWNAATLSQQVPPGTELKDDVHFVRVMLDNIKATFNVDNKRIFATGFSNGGGFVLTRLMIEMNDAFAAFAISGSGLFGGPEGGIDASKAALRVNASLYSVLGTNDEKVSEGTGHPRPFPIRAEDIFKDPMFHQMFVTTTTLLSLDATYTAETQAPFSTLTFNKSQVGAKNEYIFLMVDNMGHVYPSGDNNRARLDVSELFWDFFLRHAKP